jgi:hypothetical protein
MDTPQIAQPSSPVETCKLATWSLILGILSFVCCGPVTAIPAVICGHMALGRIRSSGGALVGEGLAIGGLVVGYIGIVFGILAVILGIAVAVPALASARNTAQKVACMNNLRQMDMAKEQAAAALNLTNGAAVTEDQLAEYIAGGVASLKCKAGGTYTLNPIGTKPACTVAGHSLNSDD